MRPVAGKPPKCIELFLRVQAKIFLPHISPSGPDAVVLSTPIGLVLAEREVPGIVPPPGPGY